MNYTNEEKAFIAANRPVIRVEEITFGPIFMDEEGVQPGKCCCFLTDEASEAIDYDKGIEGITASFKFRDSGARYDQKYISFNCSFQIIGDLHGETVNIISTEPPYMVFSAVADSDGLFSISVPFFIRTVDYESEGVLEDLKESEIFFSFNDITIGNQFVEQHFDSICGIISKDNKAESIEYETIQYDLAKDFEHIDYEIETPDDND